VLRSPASGGQWRGGWHCRWHWRSCRRWRWWRSPRSRLPGCPADLRHPTAPCFRRVPDNETAAGGGAYLEIDWICGLILQRSGQHESEQAWCSKEPPGLPS
jgi:hypothetical protein